MSNPLSNETAALALQNLPALIGLVAGNRLATVNATIQAALTNANADRTGEITRLQVAFDKFEDSNPLVAEALAAARQASIVLGLQFPSEEQIFAQVMT